MKTGNAGKNLIKSFESLRLKAYIDDKYGKILTIGWGHTTGVTENMRITKQQADELLADDLMCAESAVNVYVRRPLNQNQFDALVSFVYNLGSGAFRRSKLLDLINNNGSLEDIRAQFMLYTHDNGVELAGLVKRRKAEADLYCTELIPDMPLGGLKGGWRKIGRALRII